MPERARPTGEGAANSEPLRQLARIYDRDRGGLTPEAARTLIRDDPEPLAQALFHEAADSDDVTSIATALDYFEGRVASLGDLLTPEQAAGLRHRFGELVAVWGE